jgi:hypothetical protein
MKIFFVKFSTDQNFWIFEQLFFRKTGPKTTFPSLFLKKNTGFKARAFLPFLKPREVGQEKKRVFWGHFCNLFQKNLLKSLNKIKKPNLLYI